MAVPEGWSPIPEITNLVPGAHERSTYRWADAGKLPVKTIDGVKYVEIAAVRALVAAKNGTSAPAATGSPPTVPPAAAGSGKVAAEDGELASVAFAAFDEGEKPRDLVQKLKIAPAAALALWRQFIELREAGGGAGPTTAERLAALEAQVAELTGTLAQYTDGGTLPGQVAGLAEQVGQLAGHVNGLPVRSHLRETCKKCGSRGYVAVPHTCTICGDVRPWGFYPPGR
jgi:hypothetical protein